MFTRSIHPQNSGLSVSPRPLSLSLFFSVQYPEPLSVPFNPLRQSVPGERLSYFPADKHTFPFVFTRFNTRCISAVILITRHGFKFKIELFYIRTREYFVLLSFFFAKKISFLNKIREEGKIGETDSPLEKIWNLLNKIIHENCTIYHTRRVLSYLFLPMHGAKILQPSPRDRSKR